MAEESSSDDDWHVSIKRKCWECGKKFSDITSLMTHYKSHDIKATCHICEVTFRRLTSLSTHLDNAHSPPLCKNCHQSFSNVWELNRHAGTDCMGSAPIQEAPSLISAAMNQNQRSASFSNLEPPQQSTEQCDSVSEFKPQQRFDMKPERPETSVNSVEYIVGEDDSEKEEDSTSSESDDEDEPHSKTEDMPHYDQESDRCSRSSSTDCSSDSLNGVHSKSTPTVFPGVKNATCATCGRGPFRSMKLHLLHCTGVRVKYQCSMCKKLFLTETSLNKHYMPLYACDVCGQVFPQENSYLQHQCPKVSKSPLVFFCSQSRPHACKICKSFFTTEKTLLSHVTRVHTSVINTKVCIITNPSALADRNVLRGVHGTAVQSAVSCPNVVNRVLNGKLHVGQTYAGSLSAVLKSSPSSLLTSSYRIGGPPVPICMASAAATVRLGNGVPVQPTFQPLSSLCKPSFLPVATDTTPDTAISKPGSPPTPTVIAMFENDSHDLALMKRMNTGWRFKASYPCRQCGAILRQPSLIISHRYLHRGRRTHQCQCGRAFKHRLHLLRHCVQHAESVSYICVSCGETFSGAKLLAEHMKGKSQKKSRPERKCKLKVNRKCRMPLTCDCGQLFFRPSAYIWHQLQNRTKTKRLKKPLK